MKFIAFKKIPALLAMLICAHAHATYTVDVFQDGNDVIATGQGTINLSALTPGDSGENLVPFVMGEPAVIALGAPDGALERVYEGVIEGPFQIGLTYTENVAVEGIGELVGISKLLGRVIVPDSYVSGEPLSSGSRWGGATIASLALTPGTYTWTWGQGDNADSFVLNIMAPSR